ncbi:MAG: DUF4169 family protein [Beijerinckiaceae bacterium]|nr:DUF4169 family protein [Beijerinckiaceae bacterium]
MTAEIVNLRKARKAAARKSDERAAEANRVTFGERKADKTVRKLETKRAEARHEAGKLDPPADQP